MNSFGFAKTFEKSNTNFAKKKKKKKKLIYPDVSRILSFRAIKEWSYRNSPYLVSFSIIHMNSFGFAKILEKSNNTNFA